MAGAAAIPAGAAAESRGAAVLRKLARRPSTWLSLGIIALTLVCALFAEWISPRDAYAQDLALRLKPPSFLAGGVEGHLLGTDQLGRDILARIIHGARVTLLVSLSAVIVAGSVGVAAGVVAGYRGGRLDQWIMRAGDMQLAFPVILLVISVVAVVGPSISHLIVIMGLSGWPRFARIARGSVLTVKQAEFIAAARSVGATQMRIMLHHILPNILSALIVYASFELARMILLEATLSFLGLGVQPPTPTWGGMINDGRQYIYQSWTVSLAPGLAIALLIMAFNMLGDDLRDALDPHLANE